MELPGADTLAIRQLRIRRSGTGAGGAPADQRVPRATVTQLQQQLDQADWPDSGEAWVFIRSVAARGSARQLGERLSVATRERLRQTDGQEVVRFANLAELLAALIADLLSGQALQRWYWQRWKDLLGLPLRTALNGLLSGQVALLPSLVARLDQQGLLPRFMEALDEATAHQLAGEMAWRGGFALPGSAPLARERERLADAPLPDWLLRQRPLLVRRWQPALAAFPAQDACHTLALLLMAQSLAPLMLQRAPVTLLAQLQTLLMSASGHQDQAGASAAPPTGENRHRSGTHPLVQPGSAELEGSTATAGTYTESDDDDASGSGKAPRPRPSSPAAPAHVRPAAQDAADTRYRADPSPAAHPAAATPEHDTPLHPGSGHPLPTAAANAVQPHATLNPVAPATPTGPSALSDFASVITHQGGLLYLLNLLNRSEAQALLGDYWEQLPNGWGWLYRLGQELQLDETDPLVTLMAHQLGFENSRQLDQLPPLPARTDLLALAIRWYGRSGLWHNGLLQLQARIAVSPSHVDLYAPLTAVQLPVRLAGLDINPGWLPWLGKVVSFHYD